MIISAFLTVRDIFDLIKEGGASELAHGLDLPRALDVDGSICMTWSRQIGLLPMRGNCMLHGQTDSSKMLI